MPSPAENNYRGTCVDEICKSLLMIGTTGQTVWLSWRRPKARVARTFHWFSLDPNP